MKRIDSHTSKRKNAPPQLMLNGISTFGGPADASDKKARRRLPRITDAHPDLCPQIMVMQLEGSRMHALDTSEQCQRSGSWSALLSALGTTSQTARSDAEDESDVTTPPPVGRHRYRHGFGHAHVRYQPSQRSPLSSASSEMSPSPEPASGHYSDPATYAESPHHSMFKSSLGLVDLRGRSAMPSYLRPHRDSHESTVGPATPLDLTAGQKSSRDPAVGLPPPLWSIQRQSLGVDAAAAYRRDALASLPAYMPKTREHVLEHAQPGAESTSSPSASPPASQLPALPLNSDSDLSPASGAGRRSFFDTVLNPSTREQNDEDDDAMLVDTDLAPSPRRRSAPAASTPSTVKARGSLSFRTSEYITRTYTVVPATARPPRRERVSDPAVKPFACRHCTRRYPTEAQRDAHLDKHKYPCNLCDAVLTDLSTLKAHMDRHAGVRSFTCDCAWPGSEEPCGKSFVTFGDLYQHMRQTHGVVPKSQGETINVKKSSPKS